MKAKQLHFDRRVILGFACALATTAGTSHAGITNSLPLGVVPMHLPTMQTALAGPTAAAVSDGMDYLMAFGAAAVALLLVCQFTPRKSPWLIFGRAFAALLAGIYAMCLGDWPLGVLMLVYHFATMLQLRHRHFRRVYTHDAANLNGSYGENHASRSNDPSRVARLFGSN
jgi:hypothetical protein